MFARNSLPFSYLLWPFYRGYREIGPATYHAFEFRTSLGPGLLDPKVRVLKLDYELPANPSLSVRRVVDEIVQLGEGIYLGKAHLHWLWGSWQTVAFFLLRKQDLHLLRPYSPMRTFDPAQVAHYEKENWVAYYRKDWLRLLQMSVGMVKHGFGLNLLQAVYAAYLVARAEMAAAPFPVNDIPKAEAYMRRFYSFIRRVHHEEIEVDPVAHLDVNWWVVHRKLFGQPDKQELVDALSDYYAVAYQVPREWVQEAARLRTLAMTYSDDWILAGKPMPSPLLEEEETALFESYRALRQAVQL